MHALWRRTADYRWLAKNATALDGATGGSHAVVEQPNHAHILVEYFCATTGEAKRLHRRFGGTIEEVAADWLERCAQEQLHPPICIGKRLVVVADSAQLQSSSPAKMLFIPAGAAFGTGDHATTAMSLRLLDQASRGLPKGWRALDVGTGTGILAFAAHCFGAGEVIGIDNDPVAIKTAKGNAAANKISRVKLAVGDARRPPLTPACDIVTANLFSELFIEALPRLKSRLKRGGRMIVSGVLRAQERDVLRALEHCHFASPIVRRRGKWIAISAERRPAQRPKT